MQTQSLAQPGARAAGTLARAGEARPQGGKGGAEAAGRGLVGLVKESPKGPSVLPCHLQVAAEYEQAHRTMAQPPVQDYVPFAWTTLVRVKAEHFRALAHYHAATALCHGSRECPAPEPGGRQRPGGGGRGSRGPLCPQQLRRSSWRWSRPLWGPQPHRSPGTPHWPRSPRSAGRSVRQPPRGRGS